MEPVLSYNDKQIFYKYLDKSKIYFEFGSGGSTYQAFFRKNIQKIYSVESDLEWYNKLQEIIKNENETETENEINLIYHEMDTKPNTWGKPGPNSTELEHKNYSNHIIFINETDRQNIDLVLIDGRFRVACCLKCFDIINNDCVIAFDDFLTRPHYHIVLNYYDIIEKTEDNRMVFLKKKQNINSIPKEVIEQYELIYL
jgi:hypothetical protein